MKKYSNKYINKEFITKEGLVAKVIDGSNKNGYCTIKIKGWVSEVNLCHLKKGVIKYPYQASVYGKGYIGIGKHETSAKGKETRKYKIWGSTLQRCYSEKFQKRCPTYKGCSVSNGWLNFQNFGRWYDDNYIEGFELDKDLLIESNKVYSENNCVFIPLKLNKFLASKQRRNSSGYTGVSFYKTTYKYRARINDVCTGKLMHLGYFNEVEKASEAYLKARIIMVDKIKKILINDYKIVDKNILNNIR